MAFGRSFADLASDVTKDVIAFRLLFDYLYRHRTASNNFLPTQCYPGFWDTSLTHILKPFPPLLHFLLGASP